MNDLHKRRLSRTKCGGSISARGFTLVEILITTTLLLLLAAVALPSIKSTLKSQKESQTARQIVAFFESARSRAIASQERVGVLIDRAGNFDEFSRSYAYELRQTSAVPAYRGDSDNTQCVLIHDDYVLATPGQPDSSSQVRDGSFNACLFRQVENPLLRLAAQILNDGDLTNDHLAPIQAGDFISFDGGRRLRVLAIGEVDANDTLVSSYTSGGSPAPPWEPTNLAFADWNLATDATYIKVRFDSRNLAQIGLVGSTFAWPEGTATAQAGRYWIASQFTVHRSPTVSSIAPLRLPRSMAIDLNYSGIGPAGVNFSPFQIDPTTGPDNQLVTDTALQTFGSIAVVFAPDGSVDYAIWNVASAVGLVPVAQRPAGQFFFMLGNVDGIRPDDPFSMDDKAQANILNPSSVWITINPSNGGVLVSPNVPPAIPATNQTIESRLASASLAARALAFESEAVEAN